VQTTGTAKSKHMLNYFKISLFFFLHTKIKRARTIRLQYFCLYFSDFKQTFSTLKVQTHETYQHQGDAQLQPKAGERCHSPSQVAPQLRVDTGRSGADTGHRSPLQPPSGSLRLNTTMHCGRRWCIHILPSSKLYYAQP